MVQDKCKQCDLCLVCSGIEKDEILAPGSADALVALEVSEVLRPGFLELLKPDGVVVLNQQRIVPANTELAESPSIEAIRERLGTRRVVELDALREARAIGDEQGRVANVIALGVLSTLPPLSSIPQGVWRQAIARVSPREEIQRANVAAFVQGRQVTKRIEGRPEVASQMHG